jgi:hypothetical protein
VRRKEAVLRLGPEIWAIGRESPAWKETVHQHEGDFAFPEVDERGWILFGLLRGDNQAVDLAFNQSLNFFTLAGRIAARMAQQNIVTRLF